PPPDLRQLRRRSLPGSCRRQTCGNFDADPCLEWSGLEACQPTERCDVDDCVARPAPVGVVINEILYDIDGADAPGVFVELHGPPGTDLTGATLVGVNGSNGSDYAQILLTGTIPGDGFYVVAHPDAAPALAAQADQLDRAVDFQNGPDSVQLRFGARVLDAVGYGLFGVADTFAGEGTPVPEPDVAESLSRDAAHTDTQDNARDFAPLPPSPGAARACADACDQDAQRCTPADEVERCVRQANGCTDWSVVEACDADGGRCVDGACQGAVACNTPGVLGMARPLPGLQANFTCLDALPRPGGGWAIVTGNPGDGVDFGLIDQAGDFTAGPHGLGSTNFPPWGNSASSVYYPSLAEGDGQYAITWSIFSNQGNRDIAFRRVTYDGQPIPRQNPVISGGRKGFSPQVRVGGRGFIVLFNAYRQLSRIDLDSLGTILAGPVDVGQAHGDTREETFLAWEDGGADALLAYAVNTVDFGSPHIFVQPLTADGAADGARRDLGEAMVTAGNRNAYLFRLGGGRYGIFWRQRLADAGRTEALNYAVINRAGVVERRVEVNELDRPQVYKPHIRPEDIRFDGERFAIYHERFFPNLEANHWVIQWMTPDGVPIERDDLGASGHGRIVRHPETGWHLIRAGSPISIAPLGCE
ncbi:MAG: hypothetical protein KC549_16980, partial [Myxococcales bacterium]|nr:hypothetical protein [Myxococcales bacterium]